MRRTAHLPVTQDRTHENTANGFVPASAPRWRDQPFLQVLQDVAAQMDSDTVELSPERQHGKPTVAGTRLPVSVVLTYLAAGHTLEQIVTAFPYVTVEQLRGAVEYAAELLDQDVGV